MNFLVVWEYKNKILILISKKILSKCLRENEQFMNLLPSTLFIT